MNLSPAPKTPIRTPQPGSSAKTLQLTPIWEEVVKNNRLPPDVNKDLIFKEISVRLEDLEWPVRQHAFRVLYDIIPIISNDRLDERIIQNNILSKLVINLGHPAPGIRKVASETIQKYLKETSQSEKMLEDFLRYGVKEKDLVNTDQAGILRENITLGTIISLVDVLKPFIVPENGGYSISQSFLVKIVEALAGKVKNPLYRDKCLETLWKLSEMVGKTRFSHTLENVPDNELLVALMDLKQEKESSPEKMTKSMEENSWSDETKSENSFAVTLPDGDSFDFDRSPPYLKIDIEEFKRKMARKMTGESSEDFSDGTDTETYTKEPAPTDLEVDCYPRNCGELSNYTPPSFVPIDKEYVKDESFEIQNKEENQKIGSAPPSPRVVLKAEIQLPHNKSISMKITEDEKESQGNDDIPSNVISEKRFTTEDGDLIMKVLRNNEEEEEDEEEKTRTPRRVRFGGEVIKLRTPDSDTTDITIEIQEENSNLGNGNIVRETSQTLQNSLAKEGDRKPNSIEPRTCLPSHIPLPVVPVTKSPVRDLTSCRKAFTESSKMAKENRLAPKSESTDSAVSSSGSETETKDRWTNVEDSDECWQWSELRLVEDNILADLKNKDNWKIQYQALEQLKLVLINPKTIERIGKTKNHEMLNSLFKCLLYKLPTTNNQQVTTLSLSIVSQLIETLPGDVIRPYVDDIVQGLCRYVGGCKNVNLKIESVHSLKMLFGILEPSSVIDVLISDDCLFSSNSKLRENSLLAIMYATMTFPSDFFDVDKILEKVTDSVADTRRRVRHAALEAIAILSQFCSSEILTENVARVADSLSTPKAKAQFIASVQARLSRRLLPTISSEGLVLYALQIPASRRFGNVGNPMGADVDWILSGTGSLSTGSAKSKSQLNAAQRLEMRPTGPLSPNKWSNREIRIPSPVKTLSNNNNSRGEGLENPWTIQKNRTEALTGQSMEKPRTAGSTRFYKTRSAGNLHDLDHPQAQKFENLMEQTRDDQGTGRSNYQEYEISARPEDITWALVPISALEEQHLSRERSNSLWGESVGDNNHHYLSPALGQLRPLYLKLQPNQEQLLLSRSSDDVRRNSYSFGIRKEPERFDQEDYTEIRLLTPTILREKNTSDSDYRNGKEDCRSAGETTNKIPALYSNNVKPLQRVLRSTMGYVNERKVPELDEVLVSNLKRTGINHGPDCLSGSPTFLPSIHNGHNNDNGYSIPKVSPRIKVSEVDEIKLQDTMTQLTGLLGPSKVLNKDGNRDLYPMKTQLTKVETIFENEKEIAMEKKLQPKSFNKENSNEVVSHSNPVASAPPIIRSGNTDHIPSTSSSNSTDFGTFSERGVQSRRNKNTSGVPYLNQNAYKTKLKYTKSAQTPQNKGGINMFESAYLDKLKPMERPKEGLDTCFNQLGSQQWETNILGLTSLARLLKHHPAIVLSQLHPIIAELGRQIRNLRSQVSRAACQVSADMFLILKRNVESDLDDLSGPLFHRAADTNRFIRADCNHALDNMVDNVGPAKAINVIISKGTTHQNAMVRAVAARLLLRLSERVGPEKVFSLPKEIRDKMLQAGANLLTEGKLETRAFAKEVFRVWSSHPSFTNLISHALPPNVLRHINKTLISLKS